MNEKLGEGKLEEDKVLEKLGFKQNKERNYWYKIIIPSGSIEGKKYVLYYRNGEFWTAPRMDKDHVAFLGEVLLFNAHNRGEINIFEADLSKPIQVTIDDVQHFAELSMTPEAIQESKNGRNDKKANHFEVIAKLTDYDILEIFSDSGTGKSKIAWAIAYNALQNGYKIYYYDTERNISSEYAKKLGDAYHYDPSPLHLIEFKKNLPRVNLLVIDSVGMPFLIRYAEMNLSERGTAILELISFMGALKEWCIKNKSVAVVTNQPTSELGEIKDKVRKPFGGKAFHIAKEVLVPELIYSTPQETAIVLKAFRMRDYGTGTEIANVLINENGININWKLKVAT